MTEAEWLTSTDTYPMLNPLEGKISDRKCVLLSLACLRRIGHLLTDERTRKVVAFIERWVDGRVGEDACNAVCLAWWNAYESGSLRDESGRGDGWEAIRNLVCYSGAASAFSVAHGVAEVVGYFAAQAVCPSPDTWSEDCAVSWRSAESAERRAQADLAREILGLLPFRPVAINPALLAWNGGAVVKVAQGIYDDQAFDRLPILADMLEEAGCDHTELIQHCRSQGPHVLGCWAVDLILCKD